MRHVLVIAGLVVSAPAHALKVVDLGSGPGEELGLIADWVEEIRADMANATKVVPRDCGKILAALNGQPVVTTNKTLGKRGKRIRGVYELSNAAVTKFCKDVALVEGVVVKDAALFATMIRDMALFTDTSRGAEPAAFGSAQADKCDKAVDALTAAKVPASFPFVLRDDKKRVVARTVGQLKAKICTATRTAANRYAKKLEGERKAFEAKVATSGLTGDKLDWFRHYNGQVFLAGGVQPKNLKKLAEADVWFAYVVSNAPDRDGNLVFTVRRYTFADMKLTGTTETQHAKPPAFRATIGTVMN